MPKAITPHDLCAAAFRPSRIIRLADLPQIRITPICMPIAVRIFQNV